MSAIVELGRLVPQREGGPVPPEYWQPNARWRDPCAAGAEAALHEDYDNAWLQALVGGWELALLCGWCPVDVSAEPPLLPFGAVHCGRWECARAWAAIPARLREHLIALRHGEAAPLSYVGPYWRPDRRSAWRSS